MQRDSIIAMFTDSFYEIKLSLKNRQIFSGFHFDGVADLELRPQLLRRSDFHDMAVLENSYSCGDIFDILEDV